MMWGQKWIFNCSTEIFANMINDTPTAHFNKYAWREHSTHVTSSESSISHSTQQLCKQWFKLTLVLGIILVKISNFFKGKEFRRDVVLYRVNSWLFLLLHNKEVVYENCCKRVIDFGSPKECWAGLTTPFENKSQQSMSLKRLGQPY